LLLDARRPIEAEAMLAEGLVSAPEDVEAWLLLTVSLQQQDRFPAAIQAAERACSLAPDLAEAHVQRARALARFGRRWDACDAATVALRLAPDRWEGHAVLAEALAEASALRPPAHVTGNLVRRRGLRDAIAHAERAVALAPFESGAWFALGFACEQAGRARAAAAAYRRVLALEPDEAAAANNLALLALRRGRLGPATDLLLAGVRARPTGGVWFKNLDAVLARAIIGAAVALALASVAAVLVLRMGPGLTWAYAPLCLGLAVGSVSVANVLRRLPSAARRHHVAQFAGASRGRVVLWILAVSFGAACTVGWLLHTPEMQHDTGSLSINIARISVFVLGIGGWLVRGDDD
jgi:Flp pilus assembly protein TadD